MKRRTKEQNLQDISTASRIIISIGKASRQKLINQMSAMYGVEVKEDLSAMQAKGFLQFLNDIYLFPKRKETNRVRT